MIDYSIKNKNSFSIVRCCIFIGAEVINIIFLKYPRLISIGIASFPDDAKNIIELLHNADLALFKAEEKGGNRIINFDIGIHKNSH